MSISSQLPARSHVAVVRFDTKVQIHQVEKVSAEESHAVWYTEQDVETFRQALMERIEATRQRKRAAAKKTQKVRFDDALVQVYEFAKVTPRDRRRVWYTDDEIQAMMDRQQQQQLVLAQQQQQASTTSNMSSSSSQSVPIVQSKALFGSLMGAARVMATAMEEILPK